MAIVGIDLGTTRSLIANVDAMGRPAVIPNSEGDRLTPSVVLFKKDGAEIKASVGKRAKNAVGARPEDIVQLIKRHMCEENYVFIDADGKEWRPETISALILKKMKADAERQLGDPVTHAIITVPYYFGNLERERTRQAGEIAGLNVLGILDEPVAAVYAYVLDHGLQPMTCCVYDFGGGTFDVSIVEVTPEKEIVVRATSGDRFLGGADLDVQIVGYFADRFRKVHNIDPLANLRTFQEFQEKAERAKEDLTYEQEVFLALTAEGKTLDLTLRRKREPGETPADPDEKTLEEIILPFVERTMDSLDDAMIDFCSKRQANGEEERLRIGEELRVLQRENPEEWRRRKQEAWASIDRILLVGGSSRIPLVTQMLQAETGRQAEAGFNPDEVVALGAAIQAAWKSGELKLAETGKPAPEVRDKKGTLVLPGKTTLIVSHSLGIKAKDPSTDRFVNSRIIFKGAEIPDTGAVGRQMYYTSVDRQTAAELILLQGEEDDPAYCRDVGTYMFEGIPARPQGAVKFVVQMTYDRENIVHVVAWALETSKGLEEIAEADLQCAPKLEVNSKVEFLDTKGVQEQKKIVDIIKTS